MGHLTEHGPNAGTGVGAGEAGCRSEHAYPALLGAIRGTEWWHCRSCGEVWAEPQRQLAGDGVIDRLAAQRA